MKLKIAEKLKVRKTKKRPKIYSKIPSFFYYQIRKIETTVTKFSGNQLQLLAFAHISKISVKNLLIFSDEKKFK